MRQDGTGNGLFLNMDGNGVALNIDTEATTADGLSFNTPQQTSGKVVDLSGVSSLTTGQAIYVNSNSASTSTRRLVDIINDNALSTGTTVLNVRQDAAQYATLIDQNGNGIALVIDTEATTASGVALNFPKQTTGRIIEVAAVSDLTTGKAIYVHSNAASTSTRNLIDIHNQNTLSTGTTGLSIQQDSTAPALKIVTGDLELSDTAGFFNLGNSDPLTIASAAVTATKSYHTIAGEGGTTDTLSTINGGSDGAMLVLRAASSAYTVTIDETGNIDLTASMSFTQIRDTLTLIYSAGSASWIEISRADNE
jgi:hypothetical protein